MKKNKGISLIALAIAIVIMIILAGIALNAATEDHSKAQQSKEDAERGQVTIGVSYRYGNYLRNKTSNPLVGDVLPFEFDKYNFDENYIETFKEEVKVYLIELFQSESRLNNEDTRQRFEKEIEDFIEKNLYHFEYTRILRHNDIINLELDNISLQSVFLVHYYTDSVVGPIN